MTKFKTDTDFYAYHNKAALLVQKLLIPLSKPPFWKDSECVICMGIAENGIFH